MAEGEIGNFEEWIRAELVGIHAVAACVGGRLYNSVPLQSKVLPWLVFTVIPLEDNTGQFGSSIQTNLLCDIKIVSSFPVSATVDAAVTAVKEHFRTLKTQTHNGFRFSVWHKRPISYTEKGAQEGERLLNRGGTLNVSISKI